MHFRKGLAAVAASSVMFGAALMGGGAALAQEDALTAPVVGIHSGSCADVVGEPAYDAGVMELVPAQPSEVLEEGGELFDAFEDDVFDEEDEGFLREDIDDDGVAEIGIDRNADAVLDETEVLGEDVDEDNALGIDELVVVVDPALRYVYKADTEIGADGEELIREGPYSIVVHQSAEDYDTYLLCGEIMAFLEEDTLVIPLKPVGGDAPEGQTYFGTALIQEDSGEFTAYMYEYESLPE